MLANSMSRLSNNLFDSPHYTEFSFVYFQLAIGPHLYFIPVLQELSCCLALIKLKQTQMYTSYLFDRKIILVTLASSNLPQR